MTKESEIVRALRHTCDGCNPTPCCEFEALGPEAADLIESLTAENARLTTERDEAQRRERAAVEMLIKFIKQSDDICDYCKNHIECAGEQCEKFEKGVGSTGNDGTEFPDWHWQCTDFDYGTCAMLENTPCNGCFENDCSGFEWRGTEGKA